MAGGVGVERRQSKRKKSRLRIVVRASKVASFVHCEKLHHDFSFICLDFILS